MSAGWLGRRKCPGTSWGASGKLVDAVATAAVVVHVTMQATFGRPTHLQTLVESPSQTLELPELCSALLLQGSNVKIKSAVWLRRVVIGNIRRIFDVEKKLDVKNGRFRRQISLHVRHFFTFDLILLHLVAAKGRFKRGQIRFQFSNMP